MKKKKPKFSSGIPTVVKYIYCFTCKETTEHRNQETEGKTEIFYCVKCGFKKQYK